MVNFFLFFFISCKSDNHLSHRPNVIWLVAEDLGPYIPSFGDSTIETPNLSRMATEGVRYSNFYYVSDFDYYASKGADGIDFRAKNLEGINNLEKNSIDFYASVKSLYLQDRRKRILNSDTIIETQDDSDWEEIETQ